MLHCRVAAFTFYCILTIVAVPFFSYGLPAIRNLEQQPSFELKVSLYKVSHHHAEILWQHEYYETIEPGILPGVATSVPVGACELVHGPLNNLEEVQVLPGVIPDGPMVMVGNLSPNTSYHFSMSCYDDSGIKMESNSIFFTTKPLPDPTVHSPLAPRIGFIDFSDQLHPVYLKAERTSSSSVILGAICGIIGFLIINVTVVMAVRRYSHWQIRRRQMFNIPVGDYDGLAYLRDVD